MSTELLKGKIEFIQFQKPSLLSGDYRVSVEQKVTVEGTRSFFNVEKEFSVNGPRFALAQQDVYTVFPPPASRGDHGNVLPHIVFERSTLPWEREPWQNKTTADQAPWLALLVFYDDELEEGKVLEAKQHSLDELGLKPDPLGNSNPWEQWYLDEQLRETDKETERVIYYPDLTLETVQRSEDKATVIDVRRDLVEAIIPTLADLRYLVHVRQRKSVSVYVDLGEETHFSPGQPSDKLKALMQQHDMSLAEDCTVKRNNDKQPPEWVIEDHEQQRRYIARQDEDDSGSKKLNIFTSTAGDHERAVLVANRLPEATGVSTVHLVSIEDRYADDGTFVLPPGGASTAEKEKQYIRFVSLKSWSFECRAARYNFRELLRRLNNNDPEQATQSVGPGQFTFRLPQNGHGAQTEGYLAQGYVPLPHYMRRGDQTISWYHGPLIPAQNNVTLSSLAESRQTIHSPDQLMRYNSKTGLFDVSYATAWQLGRMVALEDKTFSVDLFNWKRAQAQHRHKVSQFDQHAHLATEATAEEANPSVTPNDEIKGWFRRLSLLEQVPFNYLVPDEQMLPPESIRFFWLDSLWINCLLDGAYSVGRVIVADGERDHESDVANNPFLQVTGFLLRSEVVADYPDLEADGFSEVPPKDDPVPQDTPQTPCLRMDRLADDLLICLFAGEVKTIDIFLKPEALHFGLKSESMEKDLKNKRGQEIPSKDHSSKSLSVSPAWKNQGARVLNIGELATSIDKALKEHNVRSSANGNFTSAQFALQMIEGVDRVRFSMPDG